MSTRVLVALAAALFVLTIVVRAPARWLLAALPATIECQGAAGTLWSGSCARLQADAAGLNQVGWSLHAAPLLLGRLDADLRSTDALAAGSAHVSLRLGGHIVVTGLQAALPIEAGYLPIFPAGWSGRLELALDALEWRAGRLVDVEGTITVHDLARRNPPLPFGSFELRFAPGATRGAAQAEAAGSGDGARISGQLRDLGGPLAVSGTLGIRAGHEYLLSGLVAARPGASAELSKIIEYIGPPDAQGRRTFTLEGAF